MTVFLMASNVFSRERLLDIGPHEFRRSVQRLMIQNGFDCFSVDGAGDQGGDLFCERNDERWIIQCKWKKSGPISPSVIEEILLARYKYNVHKSIIATNSYASDKTRKKISLLNAQGVSTHIWDGSDLEILSNETQESLAPKSLRPYQSHAVSCIKRDLSNNNRALLFLATGLGKTVVAGRVISDLFAENPRAKVLVIAHMVDLVEQLQRALWSDIPLSIDTQLLDGSNKPNDLTGLTVATDKAAYNYIINGFKPDLIVIDECHHVGDSNLYSEIIRELSSVPLLGVTATPWRGDGYSIETAFGVASYKCGIEEGLKQGYLCPVNYKLFCDNIDWDAVPDFSRHAYTVRQLNRKLFIPQRDESIIDALLDTWGQTAEPKGVIFCQSIEHAKLMHSMVVKFDFWRHAELVHSEMDKQARRMAIINFRNRACPLLISVDILNEGVDIPNVNIVCFARVTHSRKIFVQQLGRGLRIAPGKVELVVLDFAADARRLAAISDLGSAVTGNENEHITMPTSRIEFSDLRVRSLIDEWIADAADLETMADESRLQFPPFEI